LHLWRAHLVPTPVPMVLIVRGLLSTANRYPFLDRYVSHPMLRMLIDQVFWRPFLTAYTFFVMSIVQGLTVDEVMDAA